MKHLSKFYKGVTIFIIFLHISYSTTPTSPPSNERILGGTTCENDTYSFVVALLTFKYKHDCGGSLLNEYWVLTAAHCVHDMLGYVVAGKGTPGEQRRLVEQKQRHPSYKPGENDIGLVKVHRPIKKSKYISFVRIPSREITTRIEKEHPVALLMGWGVLSNFSLPSTLQCVYVPVISLEECRKLYRNVYKIYDSFLCTLSKENKDACRGDSGGPVISKKSGIQIGVISFGKGCGDPNHPAVNIRVDKYLDFIIKSVVYRSTNDKNDKNRLQANLTDYGRHLEEIAKETQRLTFEILQELLIADKTETALILLQRWESYLQIKNQTGQTMDEELKLFLRKSSKLENLLETFKPEEWNIPKDVVDSLKEKVKNICTSVQKDGTLNAGGKFEWVDSILIKCLQDGSWLLVDNVNLCSSAVLDRLNSLLEPNGILTISERGTDKEGRLVEVRPHKDFRLFLTMDPKNGEISRAMRNRGIEIYLLNETECPKLDNNFDLMSLVHLAGLNDTQLINTLLKTHDFISDLILGEKPQIQDLLQTASSIAQQLNYGTEILEAFQNTFLEVYFKPRYSGEFSCNDPVEVIRDGIKKIFDNSRDGMDREIFSQHVTMKTQHIDMCSALEKIKQQCGILLQNLHRYDRSITIYLLTTCYSISSVDDLELRQVFMEQRLPNNALKDFSKKLYKIVRNHGGSSLLKLPLDNKWLPDTPYEHKSIIQSDSVNLALFISSFFFFEQLESEEVNIKSLKHKDVTLLGYMYQKQNKKVQDKFNNVLVNEYIDIKKIFDEFLLDAPLSMNQMQNLNVVELVYLIFWRFALHKATLVDIKHIDATKQYDILINLTVHYKWFYKYAVQAFSNITNLTLPDSLKDILENVNQNLEKQFLLIQKFGKLFQKFSDKPPPFVNQHQIETTTLYNQICRQYDICDNLNDPKKVMATFKKQKELRKSLVGIKSEMDFEFEDMTNKIAELKLLHEDPKNSAVNTDDLNIDVKMLPILDYFLQLQIKDILLEENVNEVVNNVLLPTDFAGALLLFAKTKDRRLTNELTKNYYLYLMNSASVKPMRYFEEESKVVLFNFNPTLTFLLDALVNVANSTTITLGNYRQLMQQHRHLGFILWMKLNQILKGKYDYVTLEVKHVIKVLSDFRETFEKMKMKMKEVCEEFKRTRSQIDQHGEANLLLQHFKMCNVSYDKFKTDKNLDERLLSLSNLYVHLGYAKAVLNSKLSLIDPLSKKTLKKKYCGEAKVIFENISQCYVLQNKLYSNTEETLHPYYHQIKDKINELDEKYRKLEKYVAVRPQGVLYKTVATVINHAFSTILSEKTVSDSINDLNTLIENVTDASSEQQNVNNESYNSKLSQYEFAISSYENLIQEWNKFRNSYPDVIEPLLSNVAEFLYGFKLKVSLLKKLIIKNKYLSLDINIQAALWNFIKFPVLDETQNSYENYLALLTCKKMNNFVEMVLSDTENAYLANQAVFTLWKCGFLETFNLCVIEGNMNDYLHRNLFVKFTDLINAFVSSWNKQQEEKEQRQREAESLYKTRTKCEEKSEEEQAEEEIKYFFSNHYKSDFGDIQKDVILSDDVEMEATEDKYKDTITYEDLKNVMDLHIVLLRNFTKTEWLNPDKETRICYEFVSPLMEKYKIFGPVLRKVINGLYYKLDSELIGSLSVLLAVTERYGEQKDFVEKSSPTKLLNKNTSDFYKDPNIEEVKSSYHILEEFKRRVVELLNEWPEQPTLKTILTVIDRIYDFDITSPVSRFLTGFEILLSKCHEWEEVAHSGVSLSQFYKNVVDQIISWRKLELNMWKDLLNRTFEKLNESVSTWWLYLYNVMGQFIVEKKFDKKELVETLQNFITKSNLAEFQSRLDLLHAFHCHATYLDRTAESNDFVNILWNLYSYFKQYSIVVSNKIREFRSPIEKKLKDYVKIVKWKDISYWSVKETMDKSHKTLHKYIKEFKEVLQQPVSACLTNIDTKNDSENIGIWDRPQRQIPKSYHYTLDADAYLAKQSLVKKIQSSGLSTTEEGFLSKTDSYFTKSRKLCKDIILAVRYPNLVGSLEVFITDVIETSNHLQKIEVDTTLPKEKQKSHAKNILQQKHRALADLFKTLSKLGVSFKSGIVLSKIKNPAEDFYLKPLDLGANFHMSNGTTEQKILTIWGSCEMYNSRSLIRNDILETALTNPAKDLGLQNIERCRGFSMELLDLAQKQKVSLTESTRNYYYLRYYVKHISEFCENKEFLPMTNYEGIKNFLQNTTIVLTQYRVILNTCPVEDVFGGETPELPLVDSDITFKNGNDWSKATDLINNTVSLVKKLNTSLLKCRNLAPSIEFELIIPEFVGITDLSSIKNDLSNIHENIRKLDDILCPNLSTRSLKWLNSEAEEVFAELTEDSEEDEDLADILCKKVEKLTENILVVIQNLYKKYSKPSEAETLTEENEDQLQDEHLKKLVIENLSEDMAILEMSKILKKTHRLSDILLKTSPESQKLKDVVNHCVPFLEQVLYLYQYFITQQVSAYRVTSKMTSILLNIFIELASKGFCIPPELSDEMDSEGMSKPSDGMGLGEGEGEKDASDKIESEDQLEDAQPAGQEKEQQEDKDCKEEDKGIEMSEDFDSKLQDKEKENPEDDESSSDDSDADEQMGETGKGADQLDEEIWGSDKEDEPEDQETEEKDEKGNKGEKEGEDQLGAKEENPGKEPQDDDESKQKSDEEKEKSKKDINEMQEPEYDEEQVDPHHGNQPELPEPEPMDLPDDLQLDEGQEDEDQDDKKEENPFEIDTMKEQNQDEEKDDEGPNEEENKEHDEQKDFSSDDEDITKKDQSDDRDDDNEEAGEEEKTDEKKDEGIEHPEEENVEEDTEEAENKDSALDQTQSNQERVEAMEVDNAESADNAQNNQSSTMESSQPIEDIAQENEPDKEGAGQSQMEESYSGHTAQTTVSQDLKQSKKETDDQEREKQKPGDTDSQRALGDVDEPVAKKLKTMKASDDKEQKDSNETEEAEMYQHIKEAKEEAKQILDAATKEQAENQKKEVPNKEEEDADKPTEPSENVPPEEDTEDLETSETNVKDAEEVEANKEKIRSKKQHPEGDILEDIENVDIEGDVVETLTVPRGDETTFHTQFSDSYTSVSRLSAEETNLLRLEVEKQLSSWNEPPSTLEAEQTWQKISSVTSSLAQDLSEQLRLVLEPTQATRLKGDFRTGRRINMRKVIPYIASQFRKDKIWLRRTKPSKREYQIVIAIDDSSSMADNHSKELAFESVSLISKALTLLESGQLAIISFGEKVEVLHKLTDQFTEKSGVKLLQKFQFDQTKTAVAKLVDFSTEIFGQSQMHTTALNAKLLVIVSDGRGVFSEGEETIKQAVRRAKMANIFMVFVIIDNPENKSSILDIRMPVFKDGKLLNIQSYMDVFPFSFYIILKNINSLPNVLSDALRQWFEIVSTSDTC